MVGGDWPQRAREAAVALVAASKQAEPSLGVRLLMDLETVFGESESIFTKILIQQLIALPESPWGDLRGKPLDERGLAHRLRQYSIKSRQIRIGGVGPLKGYQRADFADAWKRYRLPPDKSDTADTSDTKPAATAPSTAANVSDVSLVSDAAGGRGADPNNRPKPPRAEFSAATRADDAAEFLKSTGWKN